MSSEELLVGLFLFAMIWFWLASLRAKEIANELAKHLCVKAQVMLLDESVALKGLSLARSTSGSVAFKRIYHFEFASDGSQRYFGRIVMLGSQLIKTEMDAYRVADE